jgi:hypothetical protein
MVGVTEALSHPSYRVKRLLEQALNWADAEPVNVRETTKCRTARQLRSVELDELVKGYRAGKTGYQLGAQFGIDRRTVGKHLRARGVDTTPAGLHPDDVLTAAALYRSGWSLAQVGEKFGTAATTAHPPAEGRRGDARAAGRTQGTGVISQVAQQRVAGSHLTYRGSV